MEVVCRIFSPVILTRATCPHVGWAYLDAVEKTVPQFVRDRKMITYKANSRALSRSLCDLNTERHVRFETRQNKTRQGKKASNSFYQAETLDTVFIHSPLQRDQAMSTRHYTGTIDHIPGRGFLAAVAWTVIH